MTTIPGVDIEARDQDHAAFQVATLDEHGSVNVYAVMEVRDGSRSLYARLAGSGRAKGGIILAGGRRADLRLACVRACVRGL